MANDIKLQSPEGKHPVDENLRPILVGGKLTAIETAQSGDGAKVNGDFEATGETKGITATQISFPSKFNFDGGGTPSTIAFSRNGLQSTSLLHGASSTTLVLKASPGDSDYLTISVQEHGATSIATTDADGTGGDLVLSADGSAEIRSATGEDIKLDSANDISLDAGGGDVNILQADLNLPATKKIYFDGGTHTSIDQESSDRLRFIVGTDEMMILDEASDTISLAATNWVAGTVSGATVTEFSVANSAYAGMILGYTTVGIDAASDSKTLGTLMATTDAAHNVSFIAPPSGVVEIFISIYADFSRRNVILGLSDNATYAAIDFPNSADETNEHLVALPPSAAGDRTINHRWVVTGLTAGDTYKWWLGAKSSHGLAGVLRWGGVSTSGQYPPFIMKATALPTAVADFAVYG